MDDNNLDDRLLELALSIQACNSETEAPQRRKFLQKFLRLLHEHKSKCKPSRGQLPVSFQGSYEEICSESWSLMIVDLQKQIDKYEESRSTVLNWVRMLIQKRYVYEAIKNIEDPLFSRKKRTPKNNKSPEEKNKSKYLYKRFLHKNEGQEDGRDMIPANQEDSPLLSEQIRLVLEADPKGNFKKAHVENHPQATFQGIALWRCEHARARWDLLSEQLNVKRSTLSSFYRRSLKKFAPEIKQHILEGFF